jgi:hypothetical protein
MKCFFKPSTGMISSESGSSFLSIFAHCDRVNYVPVSIKKLSSTTLLQTALFPPGRFTSLSVVVIPYPQINAETNNGANSKMSSHNGVFIKVFKKLEKAGFDIMSIYSCIINASMADFCQKHVILCQDYFGCQYDAVKVGVQDWFNNLIGNDYLKCIIM